MPRLPQAVPSIARLSGAAAAVFGLALAGSGFTRDESGVAAVWLANAAAIAILLRSPRARWLPLLAVIAGALLGAEAARGTPPATALLWTSANLVEIALVAGLFARGFAADEPLTEVRQLARLGLLALTGPFASTALVAAGSLLLGAAAGTKLPSLWFLSAALGILVLTPLLLTFSGPRVREPGPGRAEFALILLLAAAAAAFVFARETSSIFLMTPVLVLAALRLPLDRAAFVTSLVCALAVGMTLAGLGPFNAAGLDPTARIFLLQGFMATSIMLTLPVAALSCARARTEQALAAREAQYRLLADHGSDLVLRLSPDGHATFVSSAATRLLDLDPTALGGTGLLARVHADDLGRFHKTMERVVRVGTAITCLRLRQQDGSYRWLEAHCRSADAPFRAMPTASCAAAVEGRCRGAELDPCARCEPGPVIGGRSPGATIIASLRDIHQRREAGLLAAESASRLRETNRLLLMAEELASLGHGIYHADDGEIILSVEAATLLGMPQVTLSPALALAQVRREDRTDLLRALALVRRRDEPVECIVRFAREAEERTLHLRLRQTGSADRGKSIFGIISDITERLHTDRQLVAALEEAQAAADFRSQFLATMSHEIRTPMTGVLGMIALLGEEDCDPAERRLYQDTLRHSADHLMRVLNDILDYSKVDAGNLAIKDEPFDLGQLLRGTLHLFEGAAEAANVLLRCDAPDPDREWLGGDVVRLRQVLSNLLSNAIKFSEGGEVAVGCRVRRVAGGGRRLTLTVRDQGPGMTAAEQALLFEPFVQGAASNGRGGTGLGLAISRRLVSAMGGEITVDSIRGRGSLFTIELQLAAAQRDRAPSAARLLPAERSLDLLLAEDNPVNQLLLKALLKRMNHRVTCVADGEAAIRLAGERRFDVILLDMHMPRCDGLTAATAIRATPGPNMRTPLVALTADAAAERRPLYGKPLIDALVTKPVDTGALAATLAAVAGAAAPADAAGPGPRAPAGPLDEAVIAEVRAALGSERLDQLLDLLGAELSVRPRVIREALGTHDLARAAAEAHSLKGASANLGAVAVAAAALALEDSLAAARSGDRTTLAPALRTLGLAVEDTQHALALLPRAGAPALAVRA